MAAPLQYRVVQGKDGRYHLNLCRKLLRQVAEKAPTQRRFALWLRDNGVKDRDLLEFFVKVLDIKIAKKTSLGEVGEELLEAARARPATRTVTVGGPGQPAPPPSASTSEPDALQKALFERFVELDGYLIKYVYEQIAEAGGYLSGAEMMQRVGRAGYIGKRPTKENFDRWLRWMRFIGHVREVGMRFTHTEAGADGLGYLRSLDDEDLLGGQGALGLLSGLTEEEGEPSTDDGPPPKAFLTAEEVAAQTGASAAPLPAVPVPAPPPDAAAPGGGGEDDLDDELLDEFDEADFGPQHATPQVDPELDQTFGVEGISSAGDGPAEKELAALSEEEEDAIRELFGDDAVGELLPLPGPEASVGLELDALDHELDALTRSVDAIGADEADETDGANGADETDGADGADETDGANETDTDAIGAEPDTAAPEKTAPEPTSAAEEPNAEKPSGGELREEPAELASPAKAAAKTRTAEPLPPTPRAAAAPRRAAAGATDADLIARLWETEPGRRPLTARDLGMRRRDADARSRPFDLFRLATAAVLMEAEGEAATKLGIYQRLARSKALENVLYVGWTLEQVLEASGLAAVETALPRAAERLIHLPRLKAGLCEVAAIQGLLAMSAALRPGAITRRSGYALLRSAYWVDREMRRLGHWR